MKHGNILDYHKEIKDQCKKYFCNLFLEFSTNEIISNLYLFSISLMKVLSIIPECMLFVGNAISIMRRISKSILNYKLGGTFLQLKGFIVSRCPMEAFK